MNRSAAFILALGALLIALGVGTTALGVFVIEDRWALLDSLHPVEDALDFPGAPARVRYRPDSVGSCTLETFHQGQSGTGHQMVTLTSHRGRAVRIAGRECIQAGHVVEGLWRPETSTLSIGGTPPSSWRGHLALWLATFVVGVALVLRSLYASALCERSVANRVAWIDSGRALPGVALAAAVHLVLLAMTTRAAYQVDSAPQHVAALSLILLAAFAWWVLTPQALWIDLDGRTVFDNGFRSRSLRKLESVRSVVVRSPAWGSILRVELSGGGAALQVGSFHSVGTADALVQRVEEARLAHTRPDPRSYR